MKPRKNPRKRVIRLNIEWEVGFQFCAQCPFKDVMGYREPCTSCVECDFTYHPVIVQ